MLSRISNNEFRFIKSDYCKFGFYFDYIIELDSDNWYLRDRTAVVKDNPLVDQWVVNPKKDAHVMIIAENLAQSMNLYAFKEAVLDNAKGAAKKFKEVEEFETTNENHKGIIVHTKVNMDLMEIDYLYGLYIVGDKAFQVITFCRSTDFQSFRSRFIDIINTFLFTGEVIEPEQGHTI